MIRMFILSIIISSALYSQAPNEIWKYQDTSFEGQSAGNKVIYLDDLYFFINNTFGRMNLLTLNATGELQWSDPMRTSIPGVGIGLPENIIKKDNNYSFLRKIRNSDQSVNMLFIEFDKEGEIIEQRLDSTKFIDRNHMLPVFKENEIVYLTYTSGYDKLIVSHFDNDFNLQNTVKLDTSNLEIPVNFKFPRYFYINSKNNYMAVHTDTTDENFVLSEFDNNGDLLQSLSFPKTEKNDGWNFKINEDPLGNYYLTNNPAKYYEIFYFFMMKIDEDFNEIWSKDIFLGEDKMLLGSYYNEDNNSYYVYGSRENLEKDQNNISNEMYIAEISNEGEIITENYWKHYNPNPKVKTNNYQIFDIAINDKGNIVVYALSFHGLYMAEIKLVPTSVEDSYISESCISIVPNPASDYIEIMISSDSKGACPLVNDIEIFDVLGNRVISQSIHPMTPSHRMNVANLPKGVYYVRIGDKVEKFVKE